jgi:hypothetical protein
MSARASSRPPRLHWHAEGVGLREILSWLGTLGVTVNVVDGRIVAEGNTRDPDAATALLTLEGREKALAKALSLGPDLEETPIEATAAAVQASAPPKPRRPRRPKALCVRGHAFTPGNTTTRPGRNGRTWRECVKCAAALRFADSAARKAARALARALAPPRTTCRRGHPRTAENVYLRPDRPGEKICRVCRRERMAQARDIVSATAPASACPAGDGQSDSSRSSSASPVPSPTFEEAECRAEGFAPEAHQETQEHREAEREEGGRT